MEWRTFVSEKAGSDRFLFKITVFITLSHLAQNSWNEGSLVSRIPKMRDPSFQEFPKWGIPQIMNSWNEGSILFQICKKYQAIIKKKVWYSWDSWILNCIEEFSMLAVYVKFWTSNHFSHSYKRRHLLAIFSSNPSFQEFLIWGIPHFGNPWNEGSLVSGILSQWLGDLRKTTFFGGFLPAFCPVFIFFHRQFVYEMPFLQKELVHFTLSSRRSADCKVPPVELCFESLCMLT